MKKLMLVFGTRPEAIKMAPLVKEFEKYPGAIKTQVCVTGQHRQMLDPVLDLFDITPAYDLDIMAPKQDLFDITSKVLLGLRDVLKEAKPDMVFVHGDTTTSLAAALAAFYEHIPVAHVEAGLRTYNMASPWPEEMNRQVTDRLCTYCFAPTEGARANLLQEKIGAEKIVVTGNTVIDALLMAVSIIDTNSSQRGKARREIKQKGYPLRDGRDYILVTGHRRENFGEGLLNICQALKTISAAHPDLDIIYPVHLNPNVHDPVHKALENFPNIYLLPPLDYLPFVYLMRQSYLILTDSGGVQEEAPSLGKPVLVMRDTTERPEAVEAGTVKLVGTDPGAITENINRLVSDKTAYRKMSQAHNPYGDGLACGRILEGLGMRRTIPVFPLRPGEFPPQDLPAKQPVPVVG
jgi:UDP-N-acetylglucosamine 2-epimerase (non-hydrolysing)